MSLFQNAVLKKYIADLNKQELSAAWQLFKTHFHDPVIQQNIRLAKEEQYQEGFLRELFVSILGYTLNPQPNYNLTTEYKNEKDSKKADGAILHNGAVKAVIELKGTDTTDLAKIETQAFSYKNNHKGCTYIITANFEKLRFYINDATEFEEFHLFELNQEEFSLLYLCLQKDKLLNDVPLGMKLQSLAQEDAITKKLYADYSGFKKTLYQNIVTLNPQWNKLELFKKTQKLLDRFLFILFAEDRLLLPPNFIIKITEDWKQLQKLRITQSLYGRFQLYFKDLNEGNKEEDIFAYNGGLFLPDEVLDRLQIDDAVLLRGILALSNYDYNTEVDVNILGHIFEHSLNEIEELQASLEQTAVEKNKTRRKKEGVFYTPRYITKYIVENTIGALCAEKKAELTLIEEDYAPAKKRGDKKTLLQKLDDYRAWLLQLSICDPACGSGAFLNAALEFLIAEHHYIDELSAKLLGHSFVYADITNDILEHNLFGVDINEEAVEIARLSLWLRTARKGRKLSNLSSNIKCGNSLIDDADVAGEKAFNWEEEFKEVFDKGGFDVVIGNPPYGVEFNLNEKQFITTKYKSYKYKFESYIYFIEKGISQLNEHGIISFITPELWLSLENSFPIRHLLSSETSLTKLNIIGESVFTDAVVNTIIFVAAKSKSQNTLNIIHNNEEWELQSDTWKLHPTKSIEYRVKPKQLSILKKIETQSTVLSKIGESIQGITPYDKYRGQEPELIKTRGFHYNYKKDETYGKWLNGEDINRYEISWSGEWLSYGPWLAAPRESKFFEAPRLIFREIPGKGRRIQCVYVNEIFYYGHSITPFILLDKNDDLLLKFILGIVNSKLLSFYGSIKLPNFGKQIFPKLNPQDIKLLPIINASEEFKRLVADKADIMLSKNKELLGIKQGLLQLLKAKHEGIIVNKKLSDWPSLSFGQFLKELEKQKTKFSLPEQNEWLQYFEAEKQKAVTIQQVIQQTDKEIDAMVYALNGLTEEEINIVEKA
jgi:type I restriction-modification system DNA methylase subunit